MKITVIAHPNSKKPRVEKDPSGILNVYIKEPPLEGRANEAVVLALAEYFKVKKYQIKLLRGGKSKQKIFDVAENV